MILVNRNQENRKIPKINCEESCKRMPVFICSCGVKLLIVPDLTAMNKVIEEHLIEHKKLTGKSLSEEALAQEILKAIAET